MSLPALMQTGATGDAWDASRIGKQIGKLLGKPGGKLFGATSHVPVARKRSHSGLIGDISGRASGGGQDTTANRCGSGSSRAKQDSVTHYRQKEDTYGT